MTDIIDYQFAKAELDAAAVDTLARTIWGEARGEGQRGMEAVAAVIMNRVNYARAQKGGDFWWGNSIIRVCRKPMQFSCWNVTDPNLPQLQKIDSSNSQFAMASRIARWAATGALLDPTGGATHYHAIFASPSWAQNQKPTAVIGRHVFYRLT